MPAVLEDCLARNAGGRPLAEAAGAPGISIDALRQQCVHGDRFFCQSSELPHVAKVLPWWRIGQYIKDVRAGHAGWIRVLHSILILLGLRLRGRLEHVWRRLRKKQKSPRPSPLRLQVGDLVRVKSYQEIQTLLDKHGRDRGMGFAPDMLEFCGGTYRVRSRVDNVILEHNPRMYRLTDTVTLEGVKCTGRCRRLCPRASYLFWRESWLERVPEPQLETACDAGMQRPAPQPL